MVARVPESPRQGSGDGGTSSVESDGLSGTEAVVCRGISGALLAEGVKSGERGAGEKATASGRKRRNRVGKAAPERAFDSSRVSALEQTLRGYPTREDGDVIVPAVGTYFDSLGEAYDFYNLYSWEHGFGIRYGRSRLNVDRVKSMQEIVCGCSGKPKQTSTHSICCMCPALIRLQRSKDNSWYISELRDSHCHDLPPSFAERAHWPSHRHIDSYTKDLVKQLTESNVNLGKVYRIIGSFFSKMGKVPFTNRALKTLSGKISREQADDDVRRTIDVFSEMGANDPGFTYRVQVDEESQIMSLLWTSGTSRVQYHYFGDAIIFDTTYRTNVYDMPFGLLVGVNSHFQTVIFGGVLLRKEEVENFEWVFKEFVTMMGGKRPVTVLTDQCTAIEVAISNVLPCTTHRWCKWHVLRKAKDRLGALYTKNSMFKIEFHKILNQMLTQDEFEEAWRQMLDKYGLEKNPYLLEIYETRQKWAKPYFSRTFCARMTSTQQSESGNHMLKSYVPAESVMHVFAKQYNKLVSNRDSEESFQEKRMRIEGVVLMQNMLIEKHAAKIYTRTMFEKFQEALFDSGSYDVDEIVAGERYVARHIDSDTREKWCKVVYKVHVADDYYSCECGMYEHMGMLCCHALKVLVERRVKEIPWKHVMKRWTVDARDVLPAHLKHYQKDQGLIKSFSHRHSQLYHAAMEVVRIGVTNVEAYYAAMDTLKGQLTLVGKLAVEGDGLGLEEQMNAKKAKVSRGGSQQATTQKGNIMSVP